MRDLALGFFFLGLGLWNKAIFFWVLAGLGCGAIAVFWRELGKLLRPRNAIVGTAAFLFGASPFLMYNVRRPNATLSATAHFNSASLAVQKLPVVRTSLNGFALFGFFPDTDWAEHPKTPSSMRGRFAAWVREHTGEHRRTGFDYAFGLALLAVPWWWRSRAARFSLVYMTVTWILMAMTRDAGAAVHHTVLLWPFPQLFVAATLAEMPWRRAAMAAGAVLVLMNLLVMSQYVLDFERNGAAGSFTDALFGLSKALPDPPDPKVDQPIYIADWGMLNTLALFHQGRLSLRVADTPFINDTPGDYERRLTDFMFKDRSGIFVGHVAGREVNEGVRERLERAAAARGYRKEILQTVNDSNGRPVFEIFRIL